MSNLASPRGIPRIRPVHRVLTLFLGASVAVGSPLTAAAAAPKAPESADMDQVRKLYEDGRARYDTLDYTGAIDLWTQAYALVAANEKNRDVRNNLVYNIAAAREKAYELDGDLMHLRRAKGLLENYLAEYKAIYKPTEAARKEVEKVQARIKEIDDKLTEAESAGGQTGSPSPTAVAEPPDPGQDAQQEARREKEAARDALRGDPEIAPLYKTGKAMVGGGAAMIGVGAVAALVGGAVGNSDDVFNQETPAETRRRRIGGYTAMGLGVGLIGGGVALVVIGVKKRNEAKARAAQKAKVVSVAPHLAPGSGGLVVTGRF